MIVWFAVEGPPGCICLAFSTHSSEVMEQIVKTTAVISGLSIPVSRAHVSEARTHALLILVSSGASWFGVFFLIRTSPWRDLYS